jgi:hypothetical protein
MPCVNTIKDLTEMTFNKLIRMALISIVFGFITPFYAAAVILFFITCVFYPLADVTSHAGVVLPVLYVVVVSLILLPMIGWGRLQWQLLNQLNMKAGKKMLISGGMVVVFTTFLWLGYVLFNSIRL